MPLWKICSLERELDSFWISALEEDIKRLSDEVEVLTKICSDLEQGDHIRIRDDDKDRELKVTRATVKCVWVKGHGDKHHF